VGVCLIASSAAGAASVNAVDDYIQSTMKSNMVPGVSIVVRRDGHVIKSQGYGYANRELQTRAITDTIDRSDSMGKQFTAAGILLLVEDGMLSLDDHLAKFSPGGPPSWHRITVRQLLTHTSGMKDYSCARIGTKASSSRSPRRSRSTSSPARSGVTATRAT
jgi:CubicO group peptidase (beta-lactamase class C family)